VSKKEKGKTTIGAHDQKVNSSKDQREFWSLDLAFATILLK